MYEFMKSKWFNKIGPIWAMLVYLLIMSVFGFIFKSRIVVGALFGDLVTILLFGWLYYKSNLRQPTTPLFKPQMWFYILAVGFLGFIWMMTQTAAKGLYELGLTAGIDSYKDAIKNDASLYITL